MLDRHQRHLLNLFADRLAASNCNVARFMDSSVEVVVFGSRSIGVHTASSDLDVLVVKETGSPQKTRSRQLDCICLPYRELKTAYWKGSELMSHIAHYGTWLKGDGSWRSIVAISPRAIRNKERRIIALVNGFASAISKLHPVFCLKYKTTIRRELQRLSLLRLGIPIPPTRILDLEWQGDSVYKGQLLSEASNLTHGSEYSLVRKLLSSPLEDLSKRADESVASEWHK